MRSRSADTSGFRRGYLSGLAVPLLLFIAALPSRLGSELRAGGSLLSKIDLIVAGTLLDVSAVVWLAAPLVALMTLLIPAVFAFTRGARWQRLGTPWLTLPLGLLVWLLTVTAQEVKHERGAFPTMFELRAESQASFVVAMTGFLGYRRIWLPALIGLAATALVLSIIWWRPAGPPAPWKRWALGLVGSVMSGAVGVVGLSLALSACAHRLTVGVLGNPLLTVVESGLDMLRHRGPSTPRQLVLEAELPKAAALVGAARLGWPPSKATAPHPHARPLDFSEEPTTRDPRGRALLHALERIGAALFVEGDTSTAAFHLVLESFRADDIHALNPAAPREIAPFATSLYEGREGALVSSKMYQAGVRSVYGLGAVSCGLGSLPYNLTFIRDLHPFPVRCVSDVLRDAGFRNSLYYGSDITFEHVDVFLEEHGYAPIVSQKQLPPGLPLGTWDAVTDMAVFEEGLKAVASAVKSGPQFSLLMSLSNHSPYTKPADLPPEVLARVDRALETHPNRAHEEDRLRLTTLSYTDEAVARFFERLESSGMAERSIVVLIADHSTGDAYVWGQDPAESDRAKAQIPFAVVIPPAFMARARDRAALTTALREAQALIEEAPLSQNDVPSLLLALMKEHPSMKAMPASARWHTLGGQVTSPWFDPGEPAASYILGINGVGELYVLDRQGSRVGAYEASLFIKTRADRYTVTPRLIPMAATLIETMALAK